MRVIYTSKGMSKKFGVRVIHLVRVIYRKIRYLQRTNRFIFFLAPQNSHIIYPVPYFDSSYAYSYWLCLQGSTSFLYQLIYVSWILFLWAFNVTANMKELKDARMKHATNPFVFTNCIWWQLTHASSVNKDVCVCACAHARMRVQCWAEFYLKCHLRNTIIFCYISTCTRYISFTIYPCRHGCSTVHEMQPDSWTA